MAVTDPYAVLGVPRDATPDQIKSAYRKLARQYHPDVNPDDPGAEEKFKEVSEAYSILSDSDKKARFDRYGVTDDQPGAGGAGDFMGGGGFGDIFEAFFGAAGGGAQRNRRPGYREGDDLRAETVVTLKEVLSGVERTLRYKRERVCRTCSGNGTADGAVPSTCPTCKGQGVVVRVAQTLLGSMRTQTTCPTCQGSGQQITDACRTCHGRKTEVSDAEVSITIPPGVESGMTLRAGGQGNDGLGGGPTGDLYVVVHVADDQRFDREGQTLRTAVDLTFAQAAMGDSLEIEGLDGLIEVGVPAGTQPGDVLRVRGEGLPRLQGSTRGDLLVEANIVVPTKLNDAQQALLKEFAEVSGEPVPKGHNKEGFLGGLFKKKK